MNRKFFFFIKIILFFTSISLAEKIKTRKVELEWSEQKDIKYYEMEIFTKDSESPLKSQQSPNQFFSTTLPLGTYKVRSRFMSQLDQLSPWSNFEELVVSVPVGKIKDQNKSSYHQATLKEKKAKISIDWELLPHIENYKIDIYDKKKNLVLSQNLPKPPFDLSLPQGEYQFTVTPFDEYGNEGEKSPESSPIIVTMAQLPAPTIEVKPQNDQVKNSQKNPISINWTSYAGSFIEAELFYRRIFSTDWAFVKKFPEIKSSPWYPPNELTPGEYRLDFRARSAEAKLSEPKHVEFIIKPKKPDFKDLVPNHLFN